MVIYVRGKNGRLSNALEGLERGLGNGLQLGMQQRRIDQQDAQYQDAKARAERELAIEEAQNARAQQDQDYQTKQRVEIDAGQKEISQYALDYQGKDEAVGQGLGAFADLQQAQNAKLDRAKRIVSKLPPQLHERFLSEQRAEMEDEQNIALMEHLKTRIEKLTASPLHSDGAELGHRGEARAQTIQGWQEALDAAKTPEARKQLIPLISKGIGALQMDDAVELERLDTLSATTQAVQQEIAGMDAQMAQLRTMGATVPGGLPPEVLADMQARRQAMSTTLALYRAAGGEMSPAQLENALSVARRATAPRAQRGRGAAADSGAGATDSKSRELDARIREKAAERADKKFDEQTGEGADRLPWESIFAREYQMLGGQGDKAPEQDAATPTPTPEDVNPDGALGKTMFNADSFKTQIQELLDGGDGRKAREMFKQARLGTQTDHLQRGESGGDGIPSDTKTLMRNRTRARAK